MLGRLVLAETRRQGRQRRSRLEKERQLRCLYGEREAIEMNNSIEPRCVMRAHIKAGNSTGMTLSEN
jgi:hypothetical protein